MIRRRVTHGKHLICTAWTGVGHGQCMQYAWKGPNLSQAFRIWNLWRFFNKLTLLSSVYKLFNWQIWVVTQPYPVQISERDIHTIFTSINITQYWWWVSRWGPLIEALYTVYWTLFISYFYPSPVSVVEKSRINPLPDIPERTFSIEDPPEEKKGNFMI